MSVRSVDIAVITNNEGVYEQSSVRSPKRWPLMETNTHAHARDVPMGIPPQP